MDDDLMIKLRSMIANLSLGDRFIGYPMNLPIPNSNHKQDGHKYRNWTASLP